MDDMLKAIGRELELRKDYLAGEVETIYFGGGTPSLLNPEQVDSLLGQIHARYKVSTNAEVTLEANPEDINRLRARELAALGVNRVSLGVQSFVNKTLHSLNRLHTGGQAIKAIELLQQAGIENLSIDLIYGIPGQGRKLWQANLQQAIKLAVPHLSCYALTIEEKTAFGSWSKQGKFMAADETTYEEQYHLMTGFLTTRGYGHYEVSNFAKPGYASRHNLAYWQQKPYLGLGPGAHSYNGGSRQFNISNNARYIKALNTGTGFYEVETLSRAQLYNEYILTGLRTSRGINFSYIKKIFGIDVYARHRQFIKQCLATDKATLNRGQFVLTDNALILADSVIVELMMDYQ